MNFLLDANVVSEARLVTSSATARGVAVDVRRL
jgi:hypothetical protein